MAVLDEKEIGHLIDSVTEPGHFVGASGAHLDAYVFKHLLMRKAATRLDIIESLAGYAGCWQFDCVFGSPQVGQMLALGLANYMARDFVFADLIDGEYSFRKRSGFSLQGQRVLIVEDILNTGFSVELAIEFVIQKGGTPVRILCLCDRGEERRGAICNVPVCSLSHQPMHVYQPGSDTCPGCREDSPVRSAVGHG